jgi:hypothetical protein
MSRCAFNPTAEQRGCVEEMIGYGVPEAKICLLIKNPKTGKPIGLKMLRKHFAQEIAAGAVKMKVQVGDWIVAAILGHDDSFQDVRLRVRLAIFYARTRMGWTETVTNRREVVEHRDLEGARKRVSEKLERLAQRCETQEPCEG